MDNKLYEIGTTRPGGLTYRHSTNPSFEIVEGKPCRVPLPVAMFALKNFPDVYCPELLVNRPAPKVIHGQVIATPVDGYKTDRRQFNKQILGIDPGDTSRPKPEKIKCPFCDEEFAPRGLDSHIRSKHPDEYDGWKAEKAEGDEEAGGGDE